MKTFKVIFLLSITLIGCKKEISPEPQKNVPVEQEMFGDWYLSQWRNFENITPVHDTLENHVYFTSSDEYMKLSLSSTQYSSSSFTGYEGTMGYYQVGGTTSNIFWNSEEILGGYKVKYCDNDSLVLTTSNMMQTFHYKRIPPAQLSHQYTYEFEISPFPETGNVNISYTDINGFGVVGQMPVTLQSGTWSQTVNRTDNVLTPTASGKYGYNYNLQLSNAPQGSYEVLMRIRNSQGRVVIQRQGNLCVSGSGSCNPDSYNVNQFKISATSDIN